METIETDNLYLNDKVSNIFSVMNVREIEKIILLFVQKFLRSLMRLILNAVLCKPRIKLSIIRNLIYNFLLLDKTVYKNTSEKIINSNLTTPSMALANIPKEQKNNLALLVLSMQLFYFILQSVCKASFYKKNYKYLSISRFYNKNRSNQKKSYHKFMKASSRHKNTLPQEKQLTLRAILFIINKNLIQQLALRFN